MDPTTFAIAVVASALAGALSGTSSKPKAEEDKPKKLEG